MVDDDDDDADNDDDDDLRNRKKVGLPTRENPNVALNGKNKDPTAEEQSYNSELRVALRTGWQGLDLLQRFYRLHWNRLLPRLLDLVVSLLLPLHVFLLLSLRLLLLISSSPSLLFFQPPFLSSPSLADSALLVHSQQFSLTSQDFLKQFLNFPCFPGEGEEGEEGEDADEDEDEDEDKKTKIKRRR